MNEKARAIRDENANGAKLDNIQTNRRTNIVILRVAILQKLQEQCAPKKTINQHFPFFRDLDGEKVRLAGRVKKDINILRSNLNIFFMVKYRAYNSAVLVCNTLRIKYIDLLFTIM